MQESEKTATQFIRNSPTYAFDGQDLQLIDSESIRCEDCYLFTYEFNSTQAGYGNREGQMVAQVITPHHVSVVVKKGEVVQAILDNEWDEINQQMLNASGIQRVFFCPDDRPDRCDDGQEKVCSSSRKNYVNPCKACQKTTTKWYVKGTCEETYQKAIDDLSRGRITKKNTPVLVLVAWDLE